MAALDETYISVQKTCASHLDGSCRAHLGSNIIIGAPSNTGSGGQDHDAAESFRDSPAAARFNRCICMWSRAVVAKPRKIVRVRMIVNTVGYASACPLLPRQAKACPTLKPN